MNKLKSKSKNTVFIISIIVVFLLSLVLSLILYARKDYGNRRTFIFPSVDEGKYIVETRYLTRNPEKSDINYYIDELLLGSGTERTKLLFTAGTSNLSCFERNGVLYLNLSDTLLKMGDNVIEIEDGADLLAKNVFQNFKEINEIDIFIGSKFAYKKQKIKTSDK